MTSASQDKTHQQKTIRRREHHLQWDLRSTANRASQEDQQDDCSDVQEDGFPDQQSDTEDDILDQDDNTDWRPLAPPSPPTRRKKQGEPPPQQRLESNEDCLDRDLDKDRKSLQLPTSPVKKRKRGRQPKYNIASLVCSQCNKTMSSRQAVISHLYTQHGICVPGTERFHMAKKLAYKKNKGDRPADFGDSEFRAVGVTHRAVRRKRSEQGVQSKEQGVLEEDSSTDNARQQERKPDQNADSQNSSSDSEEGNSLDVAKDVEGSGESDLGMVARRKGFRRGRQKGTDDEGRLCEVCGASFTDRKKLYMHRQNCQSTVCQLCGREVKRIKTHMMRHQENKRFKCPKCPKTFPFRTNLEQHLVYHNDERPHVCEVCGMRYREKSRLNDHLRTHTGLKPYKCTQCDAAFTRSRGLRDHQRVHTGEKPYGCHVCGRKFSSTGNLAAHRRKVHKMEPLPCNYYSEKNTLWRLTQERFAEIQQKQDESTTNHAPNEVKCVNAVQYSLADKSATNLSLNEVKCVNGVQYSLADEPATNRALNEVKCSDAVQHSVADCQQKQYEGASNPSLNSVKMSFNAAVGMLPSEYGAGNVAPSEQLSGSVMLNQHFSPYPGHSL